jgi:hypothetical protein
MSLPLPTQTFYRLADQQPAAATLAALIDCFYAAFTATTDYRGTALASTHQWTGGARYQNAGTTEAAYVAAPSGSSMTLAPKILVAGAASAGSATFQTDTFLASGLHAGIAKNAGAYNAWNTSTPFTSGQWSGFNRIAPTAANATAGAIVHGAGLGVMSHYLDHLAVLQSAAPRVRLPSCFGASSESGSEESLLLNFRRLDPAAQGLIAGTAERLAAG